MRIGRCLHRLAARAFLAAVAVVGVVFFISGVANATSLRGAHQATDVIAPTSTTTTMTTTPASQAVQGTLVTLTATVTPKAAGTVQFKDGDKNLGNPVTVRPDGTAEGTITQLEVGLRHLQAVFSPDKPAEFAKSMSEPLPFTIIRAGPADTTTALATSATSPITQGDSVTLIATVTPREATGTVQFKDGATNLGNPVTVANGTASETTLISSAGPRQLVAMFTAADPTKFNPSMSSALSLTVIQSPQTVTSPAQASGQSLDGPTVRDDRGGAVVNLDLGGLTDGRGVTVLDGGNVSDSRGLTLLDLNLGGDRSGVTLLDGREVTVLRERSSEGLLSALLHALL